MKSIAEHWAEVAAEYEHRLGSGAASATNLSAAEVAAGIERLAKAWQQHANEVAQYHVLVSDLLDFARRTAAALRQLSPSEHQQRDMARSLALIERLEHQHERSRRSLHERFKVLGVKVPESLGTLNEEIRI